MERFKGQKYEKLRKHHQEMGVPWTDPTFPPSDTSIGHSKSGKMPRIVTWKRPHVSVLQIECLHRFLSCFLVKIDRPPIF